MYSQMEPVFTMAIQTPSPMVSLAVVTTTSQNGTLLPTKWPKVSLLGVFSAVIPTRRLECTHSPVNESSTTLLNLVCGSLFQKNCSVFLFRKLLCMFPETYTRVCKLHRILRPLIRCIRKIPFPLIDRSHFVFGQHGMTHEPGVFCTRFLIT